MRSARHFQPGSVLRPRRLPCGALVYCALVMGLAASPATAQSTITAGWDLWQSAPGTNFMGVPLTGVPLGTFDFTTGTSGDFGRGIGTQNVHLADTIVKRLDDAVVPATPGTDIIDIEIVALQLQSVNPVDFGGGLDFHFVTLQSDRAPAEGGPGPLSQGQMTIQFDNDFGGTFDSFFDVFFDLRIGALDGPILFSQNLALTSTGSAWDRIAPPDAVLLPDVNHNLNGVDNATDFWPIGPVQHDHAIFGPSHIVASAIPEPSSAALALGSVLACALMIVRRRLHRTAPL